MDSAVGIFLASALGVTRVLFVDGDRAMREVVRDVLEREGYEVLLASAPAEAVLSAPRAALIVAEYPSRGRDPGHLETLRAAAPSTPLILLAPTGEEGMERPALALGATAYFSKPVRMEELLHSIRRRLGSAGP